MNMFELSTLVLSLTTVLCLYRILELRKQTGKQKKLLRRLEKDIEKLNSKNGLLWFQIRETQRPVQHAPDSGLTVTKV